MNVLSRFTIAVAVLTITGCHCKAPEGNSSYGQIGVVYTTSDGTTITGTDGIYDFGKVGMGVMGTLKVTLRNNGSGPLDLQSVTKESGDAFLAGDEITDTMPVFVWPFQPQQIAVGNEVSFDATFNSPVESDPTITQKDHQSVIVLQLGNTPPTAATSHLTFKGTSISGQCDLPQRIDFGAVQVNDTFTKTVTVGNNTPLAANASVGAITSNSGDDASFGFTPESATGNFNVPAGGKRDVVLTFTPTQSKDYIAFVKMKAADQCPEINVTLVGEGVDSVLSCAPNPLDFGYLTPGLMTQKALTLKNQGFAPIMITGAATKVGTAASTEYQLLGPSDFAVPGATRDAMGNLTPGTLDVQLTFKPALLGVRQGQLAGATSLMKQPMLSCPLRGIGGGPDIDVKPTSLNFGQVPFFGLTQPFFVTRKITIQNLGTAPTPPDPNANLHLKMGMAGTYFEAVSKNADSPVSVICVGDYDAASNTCSWAPPSSFNNMIGLVASGASALLDIPVRIQPIDTGKNMEWDVHVYSDDPDEPDVVVNVKAQSVTLPPCHATVTPTTLNFGLVTPPAYRDLAFTIKNLGTGANDTCLITSLDLKAGTDQIYSLPAGPLNQVMMTPGQTISVTVRAWPQGSVSQTVQAAMGAVEFGISDPTNPQRDVNLSASVATSCLVISPSDLDFGTVEKDCNSATHTFNVYNTCSTVVTVNSYGMQAAAGQPAGGPQCPGTMPCPEFLIVGSPSFAAGTQIQPGNATPATFTLKYHPIDYGPDTGAFLLKVTQNGTVVDYVVTLHGNGDTMGLNVDTFRQDSKPKADILLVVDNSCSMTDKQTALATNFGSFIQYATTAGVDFHIGVVDTDYSCGPNIGKLHGDASNPKVLSPGTPNLDMLFAAKVNVGVNACGNEGAVEPATKALTAPLITSDNAGFLRADAVLAIVVVSDAGDQSPQPATFYENQLRNIKGSQHQNQFSYNDIGPFDPVPPAGCSYDDYTDVSKNEYLVMQFNGVKEQICNTNWAASLQNLGKTAFGYRTNFFLNAVPDLTGGKTITVQINGMTLGQTDSRGAPVWSYDAAGNAVVFQPLFVPEPGDVLTVTYYVACN
jgi:hypothetical protein